MSKLWGLGLVNNELTRVEASVLHDKSVDTTKRQLIASTVVQAAVHEYMQVNAEHGQMRREKTLTDIATKMVWGFSKTNKWSSFTQ